MRRSWSVFFVVVGIACAFTAVARTLRATKTEKPEAIASVKTSASRPSAGNLSAAAAQPDSHVLRLFAPADPQFDSVLDATYPALRGTSSFQELRPNLVLVSNDSDQPVHAFVVKWTLRAAGEMPAVTYAPYFKSAGRERLVTGGVVLAPKEVRLLSLSFEFLKGQSLNALSAQIRSNTRVASVDAVVSGSIDGALFQDGTFVGADEARFQDHFECERNGQHDEGYSMTLAIRKQSSDNEIIAKLNEHIQKGWTSRSGTDRESLYYVARGNEAQLLLQLLKQTGRSKFEQVVSQLAKMPRTQLHKG